MNRRRYLATAGALCLPALSGCADPSAVLLLDAVSPAEIAARASRAVDADQEERALVAAAVANESPTSTGRSPPVATDRPVAFEGRYYDLTATEIGQVDRTRYEIRIDYDVGTDAPAGRTVDYEALPTIDRNLLDELVPPRGEPPANEGYDMGISEVYSEAELAQSELVPDGGYDAVVYEGTAYPIRVGDGRAVTVSEYRYAASEIASDAAAFADSLRSEYLFTLSGLSADERDVVAEAIDDGYYEGETTDAFEALVDRFRANPGLEVSEWGGEWLVSYDEAEYWATLEHPSRLGEA